MLSEPLLVVARLAQAFDTLAIRHLVGGSLASSIHGTPRATQDVDLLAEIEPADVEPLTDALGDEFHIDAGMIRDAIRRQRSFNVVHLATMFKADVFISRGDASALEEWRGPGPRSSTHQKARSPSASRAPRTPCCTSSSSLDRDYLQHWAQSLGVSDLLARAMHEVAQDGQMATDASDPDQEPGSLGPGVLPHR